jgi:hypothetical protein
VNESERNELRRLVDEAKRGELEKERHRREELRARSPGEIQRQTAERKAIFAAQVAHDRDLEQLAIVAQCGRDIYLVSVGAGCARVLDLGGRSPSLSAPEDIHALMASEADWLPFNGDAEGIAAVAARMIAAIP